MDSIHILELNASV